MDQDSAPMDMGPVPPAVPKITIKKLKRKRGRPRKQKTDVRNPALGGDVDSSVANQELFHLYSADPEVRHSAERSLNLAAHLANVPKQLSSQDFIDRKFQHRIYNLSHANCEWQRPIQTKIIVNQTEYEKATANLYKALGMGFQLVKTGDNDSTTGRRIEKRTGLIPQSTLKWFHPGSVHPVEQRTLPEWFTTNSNSDDNIYSKKNYQIIRNILIAVSLGACSENGIPSRPHASNLTFCCKQNGW